MSAPGGLTRAMADATQRMSDAIAKPTRPGPPHGTTMVVEGAAPRSEPDRAIFTVTCGASAGVVVEVPLGEPFTLGRAGDNSLVLLDASVSGRHGQVVTVAREYVYMDLGSTNGTLLNGVRVTGPVRLGDGDRLAIGGTTVVRFSIVTGSEIEALRRSKEETLRDALTGVFNRRYLESRLRSEFAFAIRHDSPLAVLMIDVDHFKRVNDTHGHLAGDAVLREIGARLGAAIRAEDTLGRWGGEEFVLVARASRLSQALVLGERLRRAVACAPVTYEHTAIAVTASIGVAVHEHGAPATAEQLVAEADRWLYRAKSKGRDRVEPGA